MKNKFRSFKTTNDWNRWSLASLSIIQRVVLIAIDLERWCFTSWSIEALPHFELYYQVRNQRQSWNRSDGKRKFACWKFWKWTSICQILRHENVALLCFSVRMCEKCSKLVSIKTPCSKPRLRAVIIPNDFTSTYKVISTCEYFYSKTCFGQSFAVLHPFWLELHRWILQVWSTSTWSNRTSFSSGKTTWQWHISPLWKDQKLWRSPCIVDPFYLISDSDSLVYSQDDYSNKFRLLHCTILGFRPRFSQILQ